MINHLIPPHLLPPHQPRRHHPFNDFIANTPLPAQWEPFTLDCYTGETDPNEHLKVYITHVALYTSQDVVFCKAFLTTLKGPALEWFTTLPPYSIDSFDVLSHIISTHFAGSRPHQTTRISLLGIRHELGQPLIAFIDRFSKAALRTANIPHLPCHLLGCLIPENLHRLQLLTSRTCTSSDSKTWSELAMYFLNCET